jgi:hypothetical protein
LLLRNPTLVSSPSNVIVDGVGIAAANGGSGSDTLVVNVSFPYHPLPYFIYFKELKGREGWVP